MSSLGKVNTSKHDKDVKNRTIIDSYSNTLGKFNREKAQEIYLSQECKHYLGEKVFIHIDGGDIQKRYSRREKRVEGFGEPFIRKDDKYHPLEKVCGNIDGSCGHKPGQGYFLEGAVIYGSQNHRVSALSLSLYSTEEAGYKSAFDEQKKNLKQIDTALSSSSHDRIVVEDRGGDDLAKFAWYLSKENNFSFLTRVNTGYRSRKVIEIATGELTSIGDIAKRIIKDNQLSDSKQWKNTHSKNPLYRNKSITSSIAFAQVSLKEYSEIPLSLIVIKSDIYDDPFVLLTDINISSSSQGWEYFFAYRKRWEVEKMYRELKQNFGLEKMRVRSLEKLKTFAFIIMYTWQLSRFLYKKAQQIFQQAMLIFKDYLQQFQKKESHISFLSFLRDYLAPLASCYSHRTISHKNSTMRLPPGKNQLSFFDWRKIP